MSKELSKQKSPKTSDSPKKMMRQKRVRPSCVMLMSAWAFAFDESGQVTTFLSDSTGFWSGLPSQLETYYPRPIQITTKDFDFNPTTDEDDSTAAHEFKAARTT
ncbi:hypothetical protein ASPFODRAFT_76046 [Aspergillus luchuensis CBS 106.47]|uniref:Uncharacterized protein n=1 Tax=Aspergillus luchuensis (strain CBS 106.47) TaxID=1137211 RepID=A0A1M3T007_ASPLC|nr:hypothetical protein ASPFODRAFT_76046 [Aspergillus luchuensis CBS 106.47]